MSPGIESYLEELPEDLKSIAFQIHFLLMDSAPGMTCSLKYSLPFYNYLGTFAYLSYSKRGLELSFMKGYILEGDAEYLQKRDRKLVKSIRFRKEADLEDERFHSILQQALYLNANWKELKQKLISQKDKI